MTVRLGDASAFVTASAPGLLLVDLPYEPDATFTVVRALRATRDGNGGTPRLVALTRHLHDHPERDSLRAGFDVQVAQPVDPVTFEHTLAALVG